LDGERLPIRHGPPLLGEATREVLQENLNLTEAQLQALQTQGVLTVTELPAY
jgi:crotonobetainyl-CoA:carnitine CoA-transferase CaiB-like acyl-CoA transferase